MSSVFVSHSTADWEFVEVELLPLLKGLSYEAWYSKHDIPSASQWEAEIRTALRNCEWFVVVVSPAAVRSDWVQAEVHWALEHRQGRVVPLLIRDCDPSDLHLKLMRLQHIDFRYDGDAARSCLLAALNGDLETAGTDKLDHSILSLASTVRGSGDDVVVRIEVVDGPSSGDQYDLKVGEGILIGRQRGTVALRLRDHEVSRVHARITALAGPDGPEVWIEDRQSANGTRVNDLPITERVRIQPGNRVQVGQSILVVGAIIS